MESAVTIKKVRELLRSLPEAPHDVEIRCARDTVPLLMKVLDGYVADDSPPYERGILLGHLQGIPVVQDYFMSVGLVVIHDRTMSAIALEQWVMGKLFQNTGWWLVDLREREGVSDGETKKTV